MYPIPEKFLERAKELGYELKPVLATVTMLDGEIVTVKPDGEVVMD